MKKILLMLILNSPITMTLYAQANCSSPKHVNICPAVNLINETNAGMGNDAPSICNIPGEDVVYDILAPNGASGIYVSVRNATSFFKISLMQDSCNGILCSSNYFYSGYCNTTYYVSFATHYYLWIDSPDTITFDLSIGGDTGSVLVNIPNTQGNLEFDSSHCGLPVFQNTKPFYQVKYNGVYKTNPMTLAPLFVQGTMCISTFFRNTTGVEGVKKFHFDFSAGGYSNVLSPVVVPGFYNAGNWVGSISNNNWTFIFVDSAGTGKGDFTGSPDSCLKYEFCFDLIPLSNNPVATNVNVNIYSDGFGAGFNGYVQLGCCPQTNPNCPLSGSAGGGGGAHGFGFGLGDPGSSLPIELLLFTAEKDNHSINLHWTTASEINNDYFTVEKSKDGLIWLTLQKVKGAGNSTTMNEYALADNDPFKRINFYRLKQTDFDGAFTYSEIVSVKMNESYKILVYPNPVATVLIIESIGIETIKPELFNVLGEKMSLTYYSENGKIYLNTSVLEEGFYFLILNMTDGEVEKKMVIVRR